MLVADFSFELPDELIARHPLPERDSSRLMLLDRASGSTSSDTFANLGRYLKAGDLLVMNDTRVIPARLLATKPTGGGVEVFLLRRLDCHSERWECLLKPSKSLRAGQQLQLASGMSALLVSLGDGGNPVLEFAGVEPFDGWLEREGHVPLPPYLKRGDLPGDRERYQTVFARHPGAVAAPTAGLHFTVAMLEALLASGVPTAFITLHVGLGTFSPLRVETVEDHRIHSERYEVPAATAEAIRVARADGGRVIAVGTTAARTLEYAALENGTVQSGSGEADIFIYPGYSFRAVDALITNFHLPESTLLMLVSALAGRSFILEAYQRAIADRYRFYSYGDAMFIY